MPDYEYGQPASYEQYPMVTDALERWKRAESIGVVAWAWRWRLSKASIADRSRHRPASIQWPCSAPIYFPGFQSLQPTAMLYTVIHSATCSLWKQGSSASTIGAI